MQKTALAAGVTAALLALAPATAASAAPAATPDLTGLGQLVDRVVTTQLARDRIPGAAVVVVAGGKAVLSKGYGVADIPGRTPVDPAATEFFIASEAKLFTATAAAQLIEQGRIDPDADVNSYLTAFKIRDTYPGHPVTVADLLTHTAGFDDGPTGAAVADPAAVPDLGGYLGAHQPARIRPPGVFAQYDNYGVALAGYLVQVVSGESFPDYVRDHVLRPLGMTRTTFAQPHPAAIEARLADGYRPEGDGQVQEHGQYGAWSPTGAGTVSTAADMGRFMIAQLADDPRLGTGVAASMRAQHFTMDTRLPGMGWILQRQPGGVLFKDGDLSGFHNNLALLPGPGLGVYVVYNGDGTGGIANWDGKDLINQILDRYAPDTTPAPASVPGTDTSGLAGTYRVDYTSHSQVSKVVALFSSATVTAAADGTLTTSGLSPNPDAADQHWYPIGPRLYQERNGSARIAFDGQGDLFTTDDPTVAYMKLPWYSSPTLHQAMLGFGVLVLLIAVLWLPILALVRRLRGKPVHSRWARAARVAAWLTGALVVAFTARFLLIATDLNALKETVILGRPSFLALLTVNLAVAATAATMLLGTAAAWIRGWWTLTGRLSYTITTVAAASYLTIAYTYNLYYWPW